MISNESNNIAKLRMVVTQADLVFKKYREIEPHLSTYPEGMCRLASDILGIVLKKVSYSNIQIVYQGTNKNGQSHSWIELDDIIIDITCYQYREQWGEFYIGDITNWHRQFVGQRRKFINETKIIKHWGQFLTKIDEMIDEIISMEKGLI